MSYLPPHQSIIGPLFSCSVTSIQVLASANVKASGENIYSPPIFAITLAFIVGIYQLAIGIFRLGVIIDLIPTTLISGFTTGAAVTIIIQQLPGLLGVSGINTNSQPTYGILRDMFNSIGLMNNKMDAVWGLTAALFLIIAKQIKAKYGKRYPVAKYFGLASNGVVLIFSTLFSYLIVHFKFSDVAKSVPYAIVGTVPSGFRQPQVPQLDSGILSHVLSPAISVAIVAVVEQIAIAKSFGRQSGYTINVSQELVATGITNIFGSFLGAYPATGSFSRSAVKAAAGVRTPAAGWFASILVVIALYLITPAFYFIPKATLCAIIIASISDLVSRYPSKF